MKSDLEAQLSAANTSVTNLKSSEKQLNERIVVHYHLMPLEFKDVKYYVEHRLVVAGGLGNLSFSSSGFKKLYRFSKGIPRRINSLCDRALLLA